ncbi:MAG TPA: pyruvate kinase alpha/beta domain-containing protein [Syntrophales bacterium]|mgnify:CR=1 FL=1|nr:pyruvate kinase alpha/beta domain-containing protein [Syntrophales bacterium]
MRTSTAHRQNADRAMVKAGPANTQAVLEAAARRAEARRIRKVLVATCSGRTALAAVQAFPPGVEIIAVTHVTGFAQPNHQELTPANRRRLEEKGVAIFTGQHAFGGVGRGIRNRLGAYQVDEIMAFTLRTFGQGTKVAVEISLMAADAGLVRTDEDVIAIGGTVSGCDTALLLQPANSAHVLDLKIREVVAKPFVF